MPSFVRWTAVAICLLCSRPVLAQNWSFDARSIAMGGAGDLSNVSVSMVDEQRPYRAIVLPFGLIQVLRDFGKYNPTEDDFDLVRAVEHAASPLHYIVGRDTTATGQQFVTDIRNGRLNRDLNAYRGFVPANDTLAEGLSSASWGGTIKLRKNDAGGFQGIYVGAGPYFSMRTSALIDPAFTSMLASPSAVYVPNTSFFLDNTTLAQMALAVTGGYRARMAWPAGGAGGAATDGLYVSANYHYLRGFLYEDFDLSARLDTNSAGLLTVNPLAGLPVLISRRTSSHGQGFALDFGLAAVANGWEVGFGINGLANRINWTDVQRTDYYLTSLVSGGDFVDSPTSSVADARVELPVDYRGNAAYRSERWTASAELGHGFQGTTFRGGFEQRFASIHVRGGGRYNRERFEPTGGIGFTLSDIVALDVAAFGTSANLERKRHLALAVSLRLTRRES